MASADLPRRKIVPVMIEKNKGLGHISNINMRFLAIWSCIGGTVMNISEHSSTFMVHMYIMGAQSD